MQKSVNHRTELAEARFAFDQRCDFAARAKADRQVGLWAAARLGLADNEAKRYAGSIVDTSIRSKDGRGGFDKIVADLGLEGVGVEAVRTQYAMVLATPALPGALHAAAPLGDMHLDA